MIDKKLIEELFSGNSMGIYIPDTPEGKRLAAIIDDYIKKHPNEFEQCLVFDGNIPSK